MKSYKVQFVDGTVVQIDEIETPYLAIELARKSLERQIGEKAFELEVVSVDQ